MKDSKASRGASNRTVQVKPRGSGTRVDTPLSSRIFERPMFTDQLMGEVCQPGNIRKALDRVVENKGSAGVDGMTVDDLESYIHRHWPVVRHQLLTGHYTPSPIRRVEIPKPGSKEKRKLGIPTCLDRLIQQALLQVLQPIWDPFFSDNSFGFRPGRSCHQAINRAQEYLKDGYEYVVDIDLCKFFDKVNHDRLMSRLMQSITDKRVLKLIRGYLNAGILDEDGVTKPEMGTPQGGPLSPFLSNIVLDDLDKELEKRGLKFVRYADDCNIYVRSKRSGERVMDSITRFIENKLKLQVNFKKSAVDRPRSRKFLGFSFTGGKRPNRLKISDESLKRFHQRVRELTRRNSSMTIEEKIRRLNYYLRGWFGYYGHCEARFIFETLDGWIRRRLRCGQWKSWKTYCRRKQMLLKLGCSEDQAQSCAWSPRGHWRMSHIPGVRMAMTNKYFDNLGLVRLGSH